MSQTQTVDVGAHQPGEDQFRAIRPEDVEWKAFAAFPPAARLAILVGDPTKPGPYVIRVRLPAGTKMMPHKHPEDRIYTVMSGVFYIGLGETFDESKLMAYTPGSVVVLPGNQPHFHFAKSGEYVTQVSAIGPLGLEYVDAGNDPRDRDTTGRNKTEVTAMRDVAVVSYCRTGITKAVRGALNQTHGIPLAAHVLREAVRRAGIDPGEVEDVVLGCGLPEGATGHNIGRNASLEAGFGVSVPGATINRYCGSGLTAASIIANRIATGEADIAIAGGVESISLTQMNLNFNGFFYEPLQQRMPAVWWTMNQTADFVAKKYAISREAQDAYVVESQKRVEAARAAGSFAAEIAPFKTMMKVTDKATGETRMQEVTLDHDEGPRPDTTLKALAALKPVYDGGTVTAGNASQLSDGAAAVVMVAADVAARRNLPILGLFRGMQLAAVPPEEMSIAIAPAIRKLMKHHQIDMADIDLWELHEAYAVTTLYNQAQLETPWEITNVKGGAIALGHPYGMSGIRYLGSTLLELRRRGKHKAIIGVCTAGGMATAAYLEA